MPLVQNWYKSFMNPTPLDAKIKVKPVKSSLSYVQNVNLYKTLYVRLYAQLTRTCHVRFSLSMKKILPKKSS